MLLGPELRKETGPELDRGEVLSPSSHQALPQGAPQQHWESSRRGASRYEALTGPCVVALGSLPFSRGENRLREVDNFTQHPAVGQGLEAACSGLFCSTGSETIQLLLAPTHPC